MRIRNEQATHVNELAGYIHQISYEIKKNKT